MPNALDQTLPADSRAGLLQGAQKTVQQTRTCQRQLFASTFLKEHGPIRTSLLKVVGRFRQFFL